jgi:hypothetical protein
MTETPIKKDLHNQSEGSVLFDSQSHASQESTEDMQVNSVLQQEMEKIHQSLAKINQTLNVS